MASNGKLEARITVPTGGWAFAITEVPANNVTITAPAGTYYHSTADSGTRGLLAEIQFYLDFYTAAAALDGDYTVALGAGENGTGKYTITATGITSFSIAWTDSELQDLLGFTSTPSGALTYTGESQAQGLWLPGYPCQTPGGTAFPGKIRSDQQIAMTASGHTFSVMGRKMRVKQIVWPMEAQAKVLAVAETTTNASFETFLIDGIYGEAAWGTSAGPIRYYADADTDATHLSYYVHGLEEWDPRELIEHWAGGCYPVNLPMLVQVPE